MFSPDKTGYTVSLNMKVLHAGIYRNSDSTHIVHNLQPVNTTTQHIPCESSPNVKNPLTLKQSINLDLSLQTNQYLHNPSSKYLPSLLNLLYLRMQL